MHRCIILSICGIYSIEVIKLKKKVLMLLFALGMAIGFLLYSKELSAAVYQSLKLCGTAVIPALFPMFVASKLLCSIFSAFTLPKGFQKAWSRLFGLSGESAYAFFLGLLGGYPLGVSVICRIYQNKLLSRREAEQAIALCNNSGPGFFAAAIGAKVLGSIKAGMILYGLHILSAVITGFLYAKNPKEKSLYPSVIKHNCDSSLLQAIQESCAALLNICALVTFFNALICIITCSGLFDLLLFLPESISVADLKSLIHGSLELTGGILSLKDSENAFILSAILMGWGGLCVHSQAKFLWTEVQLCPKGYYLHKLTQAFISACLAWAFTAGLLPILFVILFPLCFFLYFFRNQAGKRRKYAL